jgi:glycosyltransferase involved in cell wall biosynthesis
VPRTTPRRLVMPMLPSVRTALAHDSVTAYGGAERTLEAVFSMFPDAPLFTAVFRPPAPLAHLGRRPILSSFLQRVPLPPHLLKPLFPLAFASLRPPCDTQLILSSSSGYAKRLHGPRAVHVAYVHTPIRRVWNTYHSAARRPARRPLRAVERIALRLLRRWDLESMRHVHHVVANSRNTALQVERIYGRQATVIHPPVRTSFFAPGGPGGVGEYFLVVARLDPYKRVDLAIAAASAVRRPLVVVGDGVERARLEREAGPSVTFVGSVGDGALRALYQGCRALLFPGEEDFGIAPVEAQASARPVAAFAAGGALETVVDGVTGVLFDAQTVEHLVTALQRLDRLSFDPAAIRRHALRFDEAVFRQRLGAFVTRALAGVHGVPESPPPDPRSVDRRAA